ncbi:hypothetical protein BB934_03430 [Microvirga ossetica]|uniref:Uncharacterized protein n=2 Tax=Microvirga ossetica TaxID=1882682 RepID=A0A1B2EBP3_9HYPH|nr:hypothetical protein BB934_03430 [Microvirga ossetica]
MSESGTARPRAVGRIELTLRDGAQLFNTLDPFPFHEKDLSADAERFIVEWAQELAKDQPIEILIDLPSRGGKGNTAQDLAAAIAGWFTARARSETRAMQALFRDARLAFAIGVAVLSGCLFVAWRLSEASGGPFGRVLQESFVIVGWVVIWRPAEMVLYDWLPMVRRRTLYRRLAAARVVVNRSVE